MQTWRPASFLHRGQCVRIGMRMRGGGGLKREIGRTSLVSPTPFLQTLVKQNNPSLPPLPHGSFGELPPSLVFFWWRLRSLDPKLKQVPLGAGCKKFDKGSREGTVTGVSLGFQCCVSLSSSSAWVGRKLKLASSLVCWILML